MIGRLSLSPGFFYSLVCKSISAIVHLSYIFKIIEGKTFAIPFCEFGVELVKVGGFAFQIHMTLYTVKSHIMKTNKSQQLLPEFTVFNRLFSCVAPAVLFPGLVPLFAEAVGNIGTVRKHLYGAACTFDGLKGFDYCGKFHAVIGGISLTAEEFLLVLTVF